MVFKFEPGTVIVDKVTRKRLGAFDEKGLFETNDEKIINKLKPHFEEVIKKGKVGKGNEEKSV
jgi:hypothetical protein